MKWITLYPRLTKKRLHAARANIYNPSEYAEVQNEKLCIGSRCTGGTTEIILKTMVTSLFHSQRILIPLIKNPIRSKSCCCFHSCAPIRLRILALGFTLTVFGEWRSQWCRSYMFRCLFYNRFFCPGPQREWLVAKDQCNWWSTAICTTSISCMDMESWIGKRE